LPSAPRGLSVGWRRKIRDSPFFARPSSCVTTCKYVHFENIHGTLSNPYCSKNPVFQGKRKSRRKPRGIEVHLGICCCDARMPIEERLCRKKQFP